jgi:hypothetical protein
LSSTHEEIYAEFLRDIQRKTVQVVSHQGKGVILDFWDGGYQEERLLFFISPEDREFLGRIH